VNNYSAISAERQLVVQKYITRPFLINGTKFDLRLYIFVASYNPLRLYLYRDGLVRFASGSFPIFDFQKQENDGVFLREMKNLLFRFILFRKVQLVFADVEPPVRALDELLDQQEEWELSGEQQRQRVPRTQMVIPSSTLVQFTFPSCDSFKPRSSSHISS
jgi:hypothetical protein